MQQDWQQLIDQTVEDDILRHAYTWEPFAKGSSNSIFLGRLNQNNTPNQYPRLPSTVILRINAPAKDTPGVIRSREAAIIDKVQAYPWAPQIIANKPEQGWCLMHHYSPLETYKNEPEHLPNKYLKQLLAAVDKLQAISVNSDDLRMGYHQLLNETYLPIALKRRDTLAQTSIQSIKDDLAALPQLTPCLVHHDIHMGNLVLSKCSLSAQALSKLVILDWEYAAIGNPWFDASCLSRYLSIPKQDIHQLKLFKVLDRTTFELALERANSMAETLEELWYWAREEEITTSRADQTI